ncbi:MAG TPA: hypothetical protein PKN95_02060 [Verrucomicrobiota bacterium]|nr:hypothetical protein [Verrucomicrobiota bacterium]HNT14051.1 hypothetical protein [Verrucomicrobiota bacterium]
MQHDFGSRLTTLGWRMVCVGVFMGATGAFCALTDGHPYGAITARNAFSLKPPPAQTNAPAATTPNPAPEIELQGFTTILGRPQVLLKVKIRAKPPQPASEKPLVMEVGQREGEVEVTAMDAYAGTVSLKNQGQLVALNLKDNGAKPTPGPAPTAPPATGARPASPGTATPHQVPSQGGASVTTVGGTPNALPARPMRSSGGPLITSRPGAVQNSGEQNQFDARNLSPEARRALIEVERERTRAAVEAGRMPPLPPLPPL